MFVALSFGRGIAITDSFCYSDEFFYPYQVQTRLEPCFIFCDFGEVLNVLFSVRSIGIRRLWVKRKGKHKKIAPSSSQSLSANHKKSKCFSENEIYFFFF